MRKSIASLLLPLLFATAAARADEGMWLFNAPPTRLLRERYGFQPTADWLVHLQQSSVRFNSGGSGSFVSADGLVMTNHHVGSDCLQQISTPVLIISSAILVLAIITWLAWRKRHRHDVQPPPA